MCDLAAICFGISLHAAGVGLHFVGEGEYSRRMGAVMQENSTIDPKNPPIIVVETIGGGTTFRNVGGTAKHTPKPGFTSYGDESKKIQHAIRAL